MFHQILKNTAWLSGSEVIARITRGALVIIAARVLGAAEWGILSYALSLAGLFTIISNLGITSVLTRELVKKPEQRTAYLSTSFFIKLILSIIAALIIIFLTPYFNNKLILSPIILFWAGLLVISDNLRSFNHALVRALEKMHLEAIEKIITQSIIFISGIAILFYSASAQNLAFAYFLGSSAGAIFIGWTLRKWLHKIFNNFDKKLVKEMINASWPFAMVGVAGSIMLNTDVVMLGWFTTVTNIGYYSAAQRGILLLYLIPALIATASFPTLIKLAKTDKKVFADILVKSLKLIFLMAFPIVIGGIITAPKLLALVFGPEYLPTTATFRLLLITILINFPTMLIANSLFAYEKRKDFLKYSFLGTGSNIIFNLILIPPFGIEGAAISTIFTQLASNSFIWIKLKQTNPFAIANQLIKIITASAIMGLAVWMIYNWNLHVIITIITGIVVYLVALYALKEPALINARQLLWNKNK